VYLRDEAMNLVFAGTDTVSSTLTVGTFYILTNPVVHAKLVQELLQAWPDQNTVLNHAALSKLPYLVRLILITEDLADMFYRLQSFESRFAWLSA
jgi:cytochrome P450